jgi:hypothetical protein
MSGLSDDVAERLDLQVPEGWSRSRRLSAEPTRPQRTRRSTNEPASLLHYRRRRLTNLVVADGYSDPRATARDGSELHSDHDPGNNAAWCPSVASAASVMAAVTPEPQ